MFCPVHLPYVFVFCQIGMGRMVLSTALVAEWKNYLRNLHEVVYILVRCAWL